MGITTQDVLKANLVLVGLQLLSKPADFEEFRQLVATDVVTAGVGLVTNIPSGATEPGFVHTLNKDRITLDLSKARSVITRDYPSKADLHRLADVAAYAIRLSSRAGPQPAAFGYNLDLVYEQHSDAKSFSYLSQRLFNSNLSGRDGWNLVGGFGKLHYQDGSRRWMITVEPRFHDEQTTRIFLSLNLHINEQRYPGDEEIKKAFQEVWNQAHNIPKWLDAV